MKLIHGETELTFTKSGHPITEGFTKLKLTDETYWRLTGDESRVSVPKLFDFFVHA